MVHYWDRPTILMHTTCITITQGHRVPLLRLAVRDFLRQTHAARDLLVLHDGDDHAHASIQGVLTEAGASGQARVHRVSGTQPLGALRNRATELAKGELICQWDDDDRYHPQRLELQVRALQADDSHFCFLGDQLHWFAEAGELRWDDWSQEPYPLNFVQGTLLGRRALMPAYPAMARGEDTGLCLSLLHAGHRITRLHGQGWCYAYVYHGANAWDGHHHQAISRAKALSGARLLARLPALRARLAEYEPGFGQLAMHHRDGTVAFATVAG